MANERLPDTRRLLRQQILATCDEVKRRVDSRLRQASQNFATEAATCLLLGPNACREQDSGYRLTVGAALGSIAIESDAHDRASL